MSSAIRAKSAAMPKSFRRLWAASGVSALGDGAYVSVLPLLAASLTRDPVVLSLVFAAARLPWLLFGLIGGALVDRWDRRRTMWIVDAVRSGLLIFATIAAATGLIGVPLLIGLAFLLCLGQILFDTAASAYLPELLERDPALLQSANARLTGTQTAGTGFLGPPVGVALFAIGRTIPFLFDALSFIFSSLTIRSLPPGLRTAQPVKRSLLADARSGAAYLFRDPLLLGLSLRPAFGNLAFSAGNAVFVLFAQEKLHLNAVGFGVLLTTEALGGLMGAALTRRLAGVFGTGGVLTLTAALTTASQVVLGLSDNAFAAGGALAVRGAALSAMIVLSTSVRQAIVPVELMGRFTSAARIMSMTAVPLGSLLGGYLATVVGLRGPYLIGAGLFAITTLVSMTMTTNRKVEAALARADLRPEAHGADNLDELAGGAERLSGRATAATHP